jgi:hypothetical protein
MCKMSISIWGKTTYSVVCKMVHEGAQSLETDLKSADLNRSWGFKPPQGHQIKVNKYVEFELTLGLSQQFNVFAQAATS